ncbi:hypothetical protein A2U01_0099704, partial [Trifolium medium]|nr:hypothetical protein [Trifolium medium]
AEHCLILRGYYPSFVDFYSVAVYLEFRGCLWIKQFYCAVWGYFCD